MISSLAIPATQGPGVLFETPGYSALEIGPRRWEVAQLVKCLLNKCENKSLDLQDPRKSQAW